MRISARVIVSVVTWNSEKDIKQCLDALAAQTYTDYRVVVVDNNSEDHTEKMVRGFADVVYIQKNNNTGYSVAHNEVIRSTDSVYVLCLNPDVVLQKDFIKELVTYADRYPKGGSFGGLLFRPADLKTGARFDIVDSAGLTLLPWRQVVNRGEGKAITDANMNPGMVFGHSGACVLYRRNALETVKYGSEYCDTDFFAYKEDADLAWRLHNAGYSAGYAPLARAYHRRAIQSTHGLISGRLTTRSRDIRVYSYRNHILMLLKNERLRSLVLYAPVVGLYELCKFIFLLFTDTSVLISALSQIFHLAPEILKKRNSFAEKTHNQ